MTLIGNNYCPTSTKNVTIRAYPTLYAREFVSRRRCTSMFCFSLLLCFPRRSSFVFEQLGSPFYFLRPVRDQNRFRIFRATKTLTQYNPTRR